MRVLRSVTLALLACAAVPAAAEEGGGVPPDFDCIAQPTDAERAAYQRYYTANFDFSPGGAIPPPTSALKQAVESHLGRCARQFGWGQAEVEAAFKMESGWLYKMGIARSIPLAKRKQDFALETIRKARSIAVRAASGEGDFTDKERSDATFEILSSRLIFFKSRVSIDKEGEQEIVEEYIPDLAKAEVLRLTAAYELVDLIKKDDGQ